MRRVQAAALDLFEAHGYDQVTIEQIAAAADSSPASVYRNFGTKERILLWDDYDPVLFDALRAHLASEPPLEAMRAAMRDALDRIYSSDRERILRRSRLVMGHPTLVAAAAGDMSALRSGLAAELQRAGAVRGRLEVHVVAFAVAAALEAAVGEWVLQNGRTSLGRLLDRAFACLVALPVPAAPTR